MSEILDFLGDVPKDKFKQTMNKLLNRCFILKKYSDTVADYRFIISNRSLYEDVLELLGYELIVRDDYGVICINNTEGTGRIHFSKFESTLILIIRLLYIEKMKEVSQISDAIVLLEDIYEKYAIIKLGRVNKVQLLNGLRLCKRMNIIKNLDRMDSADPSIRIQIFPSILFAVTGSTLDDMYKTAMDKLEEYANGGAGDESTEDTDEDLD